jgi:nitrate reductase NapD
MSCDRRNFLRGDWQPEATGSGEVASILVQARPEQLDGVSSAIAEISGAEIHGRDPRGKLVVVVEAPDVGAIGAILNRIQLLPSVLSASLVFHATDVA